MAVFSYPRVRISSFVQKTLKQLEISERKKVRHENRKPRKAMEPLPTLHSIARLSNNIRAAELCCVRTHTKNKNTQASTDSEMHKQEAAESYGVHPDTFPNLKKIRSPPGSCLGRSFGQPKHDVDSQVSRKIIWTAKVGVKH